MRQGDGIDFRVDKLGKIMGVSCSGLAPRKGENQPKHDHISPMELVVKFSGNSELENQTAIHQDYLTPVHKIIFNAV